MANMKRMLTSCFGLGRLPIAPGTWGSLPPVIIFGLMCWFGASSALISNVMASGGQRCLYTIRAGGNRRDG